MAYSSCDIRNVCLVGPSGAGKTQLTEALLHAGGAVSEMGSVTQGNTVSDYTAREREQGHSEFTSVCHLDHGGIHVNLIDTPGYRDFYGRALSVLPAAETAAIVISDLLSAPPDLSQDARRRASRATGIPLANIVCGCQNTISIFKANIFWFKNIMCLAL